jgi:hypothetical protein
MTIVDTIKSHHLLFEGVLRVFIGLYLLEFVDIDINSPIVRQQTGFEILNQLGLL